MLIHYLPLIVVLLPLLAALVAGLGRNQCCYLATFLLAGTMFLGGYLLLLAYDGATWHLSLNWLCIAPSPLHWPLGFSVDFPVAVMVCLTTTISFITHLYALAYMQRESRRYFVLTGGFVSAMLGFFMAADLITCFIGWELMGLGSYLLISFWHQEESTAKRGTQAWLTNQVGSTGLLIGILLIGSELGSFNLAELALLAKKVDHSSGWLVVARSCLLVGICTKSAQFPWFSWLPSAMVSPTPASALIHSATMVAAGVYLLISSAPILGATLSWLAYLGAVTAFMGAYAALTQQHIKQVLAYSTIAQLGYAVMAIGVGASSAGLFHLVTHAFCKACLFLCAGAIARFLLQRGRVMAMQDMGGLRKEMPIVFCAYLIATCSLVGVPGFGGALSKEAILSATLAWAHQEAVTGNHLGYLVPALGFSAALLAVMYMGRQCCLVFMGTARWSHKGTPCTPYHTPWLMQISIVSLAFFSLGWLYNPWSLNGDSSWLLQRLAHVPRLTTTLSVTAKMQHGGMLLSLGFALLGLLLLVAWRLKSLPTPPLLTKLSLHGWYLALFTKIIASGGLYASRLTAQFDRLIVGGLVRTTAVRYVVVANVIGWLDQKLLGGVVIFVSSVPKYLGRVHRTTQQGSFQQSLVWLLIGIGLLYWGIYFATQGV